MSSVEASLKPELERQCTVWNNKSQIELTSTRSYGDINMGAYLNTAAPQNPSMFTPSASTNGGARYKSTHESDAKATEPAKTTVTAPAEESKKAAPSGPA